MISMRRSTIRTTHDSLAPFIFYLGVPRQVSQSGIIHDELNTATYRSNT